MWLNRQTDRHTDKPSTVTLVRMRRGLITYMYMHKHRVYMYNNVHVLVQALHMYMYIQYIIVHVHVHVHAYHLGFPKSSANRILLSKYSFADLLLQTMQLSTTYYMHM